MGGLFLLVVSVPMIFLLARALPATELSHWVIVPLPDLSLTFDLFPSVADGPFDATSWLWGLLADLLRVVFVAVYYFVLATASVGAVLVIAGGLALSDPRSIRRSIVRTLEIRVVRGLLAIYAVLGTALVFPAALRDGLELVLAVSLWLAISVWLQVRWQDLESREGWVGRIGLWYPLTVGIFVLPIAVVGLVAPTLRPWFLAMTHSLTTLFLGMGVLASVPTVLLGEHGAQAGIVYAGFWLAAVFGMGWSVGVVTAFVAWALTRIASLTMSFGRRVARVARWLSYRD